MQNEFPKASRRGFFIAATAAGATVAAVTTLKAPAVSEATPAPKAPPERGGGYTLSEHVKRYYKTTLV